MGILSTKIKGELANAHTTWHKPLNPPIGWYQEGVNWRRPDQIRNISKCQWQVFKEETKTKIKKQQDVTFGMTEQNKDPKTRAHWTTNQHEIYRIH